MESLDLYKLNWKNLDPEVRKQKLKSIEDQSVLTEIAKTDSSVSIRRDAVSRINDQTLLAEIAKTGSAKRRVCRDAVSRIKDQALLAEIAKTVDSDSISMDALSRIKDQTLLAEIAKMTSNEMVSKKAMDRIKDQALLAEIVKTACVYDVRKKESNMTSMVPDDGVSMDALSRIKDQTLLAEIAKMTSNEMVSKKAMGRIKDQALLAEIVKTASDYDVREEAVKRIKDEALLMDIEIKAVLKEIAETDPYGLRKWVKEYRRPEGVCQESFQEGWNIGIVDLKRLMNSFPLLRMVEGYTIRIYLWRDSVGGYGSVWGMPEEIPFPEPNWCLDNDDGEKVPMTLFEDRRNPPKPQGALDCFMEAIRGDGSPLSYLQASIFEREVNELGAFWHGISWGTHRIFYKDPSYEGLKFQWEEPKPSEWEPMVFMDKDICTVKFYSYSKLHVEAVYCHIDTYKKNHYIFKTNQSVIAKGSGGFWF